MSEILNIAIETAVKEKKIDLLSFTKFNPNTEYYEFYKEHKEKESDKRAYQPMPMCIDLSDIHDNKLLHRIVEFTWHSMQPERRNAKGFHTSLVRGFINLKETLGDKVGTNYSSFLNLMKNYGYKNHSKPSAYWANRFYRFCILRDNENDIYAPDIWRLDSMDIAPERIDPTRHHKRIYFDKIKNEENKALVKSYTKHLLLNTDNTINTIVAKANVVGGILNLSDIPYLKWDKELAEKVFNLSANIKPRTIARAVMYMEEFTGYLIINDILVDSPIKQLHNLTLAKYEYKETSSDKYVLTQIFNALGSINESSLTICFLVIYCTGMRVSEACSLKKNCLEKYKDTYFIRFYQTKMKKDVTNVIPKALYELLKEYISTVPAETDYIFYGQKVTKPRQSVTFTNKFASELERLGVKNADGTPYRFSAHSFRHLMAVKMREADIPFQYIVEQLHHKSPEMTLAYMEFLDRQKINKMKKYINAHGDEAPITTDIQVDSDEDYAEYMRKFINAQMLPDGVCARPVKLGKCKHCNACLFCDDYRTSSEFLDSHKNHLNRIESYLKVAKVNGWVIQEKQAEETKKVLIKLIAKLEKEE